MAITLRPELELRVAKIAESLGLAGPEAGHLALLAAVHQLEGALHPKPPYTPEERWAMIQPVVAAAKKWRADNPYDPANPPSSVWQEELYDELGLPQ